MSGDLGGRRVAVYISGSVAAYKSCEVISALRTRGAETRVAMTRGAQRFIAPLTLHAVSGSPVFSDIFAPHAGGHGMEHLELSAWAELQVAVAASASVIARLALGLADDAVTATALASRAPLLIVPAMETAMWEHPATRTNVGTLVSRGAVCVGPVNGRLASGREGMGRMADVGDVVEACSVSLLDAH